MGYPSSCREICATYGTELQRINWPDIWEVMHRYDVGYGTVWFKLLFTSQYTSPYRFIVPRRILYQLRTKHFVSNMSNEYKSDVISLSISPLADIMSTYNGFMLEMKNHLKYDELSNISFQLSYSILHCRHGCYNDYVRLYDGPNLLSHSMGKFCGDSFKPITSTGRYLTVQFVTDYSLQMGGFKLIYNFTDQTVRTLCVPFWKYLEPP